MREILFRGKLVNHDDWIFGQYYRSYYDNDGENGFTHCISNESGAYSVQPATVGQFTGLHDKNGVQVFEGDKISFTRWIGNWQACDGTHKEITTIHEVVWDNSVARFGLTSPSSDTMKFREHPQYVYEVIGNIHDR